MIFLFFFISILFNFVSFYHVSSFYNVETHVGADHSWAAEFCIAIALVMMF